MSLTLTLKYCLDSIAFLQFRVDANGKEDAKIPTAQLFKIFSTFKNM